MASGFVGRLMHRLHVDESRLERIKHQAEETMRHAKMAAEVTLANGAFSYANGRFGKEGSGVEQHLALVGVPGDLGAAVLLGGMGLLHMAGRYSEDAFNLGVGCLQSFTSRNLLSMGLSAGAQTSGAAAGALPYGNPYGATPYASYPYAAAG